MRDLIIIVAIVAVALVGARIQQTRTDTGLETTGGTYEENMVPPGSGGEMIDETGETAHTTPNPSGAIIPDSQSVPVGEAGSIDSVSVLNQAPGMKVIVRRVAFAQAGWIAVHEERSGGLGNVLGAAWLPAGTHENVTVHLLRATSAGSVYYAALYTDNGNKQYEHRIDAPVKDSLGSHIIARFDTSGKE